MIPLTRQQFKDYCLRQLGFPVIKIELDEDQIEDNIDTAVIMMQTYHYDGKMKVYYKYQMTANDVANNPIQVQLSNNIIGIGKLFTISSSQGTSTKDGFNMFDINYQIRLNELYDYTAGDYTYFEIANEHLRMLEMLFTGEIPLTYNRYSNVVNIWAAPDRFGPGDWTIIEAFQSLDPTMTFWQDPWLKNYGTALLKRQWGTNLKKYQSVTLPSGMVLNGQQIYNEADAECKRLEEQIRVEYEDPTQFIFG
jgi:hypothetical protein